MTAYEVDITEPAFLIADAAGRFRHSRDWTEQIAAALNRCSLLLVFLTPASVASRHVLDEIHFALERGKAILPVYLADVRLPDGLQLQVGRLQAVHADTNPRYHKLIEQFYGQTGVPVIMNTSFNLRGEPIVTTPDNALNTFYNSGLDTLVLGDFIVRKD